MLFGEKKQASAIGVLYCIQNSHMSMVEINTAPFLNATHINNKVLHYTSLKCPVQQVTKKRNQANNVVIFWPDTVCLVVKCVKVQSLPTPKGTMLSSGMVIVSK